ncbi:uncharacterized protein LOC123314290 isoform X1 [Coccinella septempunctata]|uniref:uncharacterized protein LOC123314290 isoform X1 n=1 Tax=Coccinella septempunctata TaxID=41139 RepID=UPI001D062D72|nr:uncharacterized protein LOC123314290 isoform X1 [Coccinella septempunctata]
MDNEEKFQYLILSTIPKSRARTVVESFPPTFENYPKAIEALKSRFGREELLIELYIRDLIGLLTSNTKSLSMLYDKLECQLRALESLGITSDKCSAMLFPLVESCLPEELLRIWQRSYSADTAAAKSQDKVKKLMDFIRNEVENEEKVSMAKSGVGSARAKEQKKMMTTENNKATPYTASELVTTNNEVVSCIFCGRSEHKSFECSNSQGSMNPADLPSRGCTAKKLLDSAWWEGPEWLRYSASYWPTDSFCYDEELVAREKKKFTISCVVNSNTDDWYYKYFSVFHKTVYMLGWIRRFLHNCRYPNDKHCGFLSVEEINDAELVIFRLIQHDSFSTLNDAIKSLFPFKDESGVLRIRTKLVNLEDSFDFRYPIVLPKHPLVVRLIREEHERACHVGVQGLLCRLREKYWIIGGRKTVRSVISKCVICKRFMSKRLETLPSALPEDRVRDVSVFEVIGIDLTGPVHLRDGRKAWIAVFTCAVYRAIHLELLTSLSTEIFIQSLRRFIARRGRPKIIYSDNGTNFVGAYNMFKSLDWSIVTKFCSLERIIWKFNPPAAPWWGGFWERLIRILKNLLRRTLGKASLNFEEMFTVLCDCEAVINSRPITFLSDSVDDLCPLTPAMFIQDIKEIGVNDCDVVECSKLTRRAKYRQKLGEQLRKRFRIEYLGQLKHRFKTQSVRQLKVGEVVLVGNDNSKRGDWPLACVTELFPGKDGSVRLVRLRTSAGEILRSVQRIFPLELDSYEEETEISNIKDKEHETQVSERADNILSRIFRTRKGCQTVKKCSG